MIQAVCTLQSQLLITKHYIKKVTVCCILILLCLPLYAEDKQEPQLSLFERTSKKINGLLDSLGADGEFDPEKTMDWSILPGPFYAPETSLGVGISAVGLYQLDKISDPKQPSSLTINGIVSINGSIGARILSKTFLFEDRLRIYLDADVQEVPDVYYGRGIENGNDDNNKRDFESLSYRFTPEILSLIFTQTYLSFGFDMLSSQAKDVDVLPFSLPSEQNPIIFPEDSLSIGPIIGFIHDSRDYMLNASKGRLIQLDTGFYHEKFGSKSEFKKMRFNYSDYLSIDAIDSILAWQWIGEFNFGDVPWDQLAKLGGPTGLRGYELGRYRDAHMTMVQIEFRQHLIGRHGLVYWMGSGTVADEFDQLKNTQWIRSIGFGYRFRVKDKSNMRLDFGFGEEENGVYFSINEAF